MLIRRKQDIKRNWNGNHYFISSESELTSQEQSEEDDEEDEPVEVKVVGKIMQDFKEAGQSIEWNSEIINRIVRAHTGSTNLSVEDVKVILHKNLEKFWKFAVRQSAFQVRYITSFCPMIIGCQWKVGGKGI